MFNSEKSSISPYKGSRQFCVLPGSLETKPLETVSQKFGLNAGRQGMGNTLLTRHFGLLNEYCTGSNIMKQRRQDDMNGSNVT